MDAADAPRQAARPKANQALRETTDRPRKGVMTSPLPSSDHGARVQGVQDARDAVAWGGLGGTSSELRSTRSGAPVRSGQAPRTASAHMVREAVSVGRAEWPCTAPFMAIWDNVSAGRPLGGMVTS